MHITNLHTKQKKNKKNALFIIHNHSCQKEGTLGAAHWGFKKSPCPSLETSEVCFKALTASQDQRSKVPLEGQRKNRPPGQHAAPASKEDSGRGSGRGAGGGGGEVSKRTSEHDTKIQKHQSAK